MPSHYLNQCWKIVNWTLGKKLKWNLNQNLYIFMQENAFENVVWKMAATSPWSVLSRIQIFPGISNTEMINIHIWFVISFYDYNSGKYSISGKWNKHMQQNNQILQLQVLYIHVAQIWFSLSLDISQHKRCQAITWPVQTSKFVSCFNKFKTHVSINP